MDQLTSSVADSTMRAYVAVAALKVVALDRLIKDERGEGVISAAIAVLIMAFLGAAMWAVFKVMFNDATKQTSDQVKTIGS